MLCFCCTIKWISYMYSYMYNIRVCPTLLFCPPLYPHVHLSICVSILALHIGSFVPFVWIPHVSNIIWCFFLSDLLYSVWQTLGPPTSLKMTQLGSHFCIRLVLGRMGMISKSKGRETGSMPIHWAKWNSESMMYFWKCLAGGYWRSPGMLVNLGSKAFLDLSGQDDKDG